MSSLIEKTLWYGTYACRQWRGEIFQRHWPIENGLAIGFLLHDQADKIDANRAGNTWLRIADERLRFGSRRTSAVMDDEEIRQLAETQAHAVERLYQQLGKRLGLEAIAKLLQHRVEREGLTWPTKVKAVDDPIAFRDPLGSAPVSPDPKGSPTGSSTRSLTPSPTGSCDLLASNDAIASRDNLAGAIARACDPRWWRRSLRETLGRRVESVLREGGNVGRHRAPYLSDWAFARWMASQRRNRGTLENLIAISNEGDELPLQECIDASVSNPINRRNELMVRMRGWETIAETLQLQGALLTLTAPSQYHAFHHSGAPNSKFNASNPIETMHYLNGVFSRIRANWHRQGIKAIGFRICEPHHDGTPHFHFLLFFAPQQWPAAWEIFHKHALAVDGDEPGAAEHRCDYKLIDKAIGSATGYIAKYVAKNIDGYGFADDELDDESKTSAQDGAARVRAWASLWGIRQFQQIGTASVTVYRELRRLAQPLAEGNTEQIEAARAAADRGDWAAFVEAMGGAFARRDEQLLRPLKALAKHPGRYGDDINRILGLVMRAVAHGLQSFVQTRTKDWKITPRWALENFRDRGSP